ncbi:MAG: hypothetical protein CMI79_06720 [Candidatus Pelagibacter sp.]|nr:hypothetical protein [Candidatus Pelagibacter sp.]
MSAALLARLKVKNQPKRPNDIDVIIKPPEQAIEVELQTKIVDRRAELGFNREQFLQQLEPAMAIKLQKPNISDVKIQVDNVPLEQPIKEITKKQKKLQRKVKLLVEEDGDTPPPRRRKRKTPIGITRVLPEGLVQIGETTMAERLAPKPAEILIKASEYYMDNREIFINFINSLFAPYKEELQDAAANTTCESRSGNDFSLMAHQKIVRDYLNLITPYRGILLYHGLGSGKTCSSIAIAEGMKDNKRIIVMTPASLRRNYYEELKKCGDLMYKKNQFWEFVSATEENINTLSSVLNLSIEYIIKAGGAWLVNVKKSPNYDSLKSVEKEQLDKQLDEMIRYKYQFISYNGLRKSHLNQLTKDKDGSRVNPFDNTVVIIDEAHNLVGRIVNKLTRNDNESTSMQLYQLLMAADNAKIIMLSGTPIINYPNEIAILFNMLRGYIKTWNFKLTINSERSITKKTFQDMFKSTVLGGNITDFIDYNSSSTTLTVTRNPFGFVNKTSKGVYEGVRVGDRGEMTDADFVGHLTRLLGKQRITITRTSIENYKALPDKLDDFKALFVDDENNVRNQNMFKRRILGLASYFRSAQENLMPRYTKGQNFHIVDVTMSDFQFGVYEEARVQERKIELNNARKRKKNVGAGLYEETVSTYRIFSRAFCNFVFPRPDIKRPMPDKKEEDGETTEELTDIADEDLLDAEITSDNVDGRIDADDIPDDEKIDGSYDQRIKSALSMLRTNKEKYLTGENLERFGPKMAAILDNITNPEHRGLHLVYSQFRTLEGIGVFKLVLEANGFAEFKIKNTEQGWKMNVPLEDRGKPMFVLYTGTESAEEKEIVRNVYNGDWKFISPSLEAELRKISGDNKYGEIIKIFMITASGAEGISLKNTRYVHIMEPYWHPVRIQQVIGRARRICSHQELPEQLRSVDVFLYLMVFSKEQLSSEATIELRLKDTSKRDGITPFTSDQALFEIANLKEEVTDKLLDSVKEASIDCSLHDTNNEGLTCFSFGTVDPSLFSFAGSYADEDDDAVAAQNEREIELDAIEVSIEGTKYALVEETGNVYDWDSYMAKRPIQVGQIIKKGKEIEFRRL